jgi:hypothetical protein
MMRVFLFLLLSLPMANIFNKVCGLHLLAYILVLVGALNW